jgi:hypothetical protein
MVRFVLPALASVAAGLLLGAAAVLGITLVAQGDTETFNQRYERSTGPNQVQYGDRCLFGHCFSCNSTQDCANNKLP